MITEKRIIGDIAEKIAARSLLSRNYEIVASNYQKPWGEIDIIAEKGGVVVFVEVKANSRYQAEFQPERRADWRKMRKVERTARTYLAERGYSPDQPWQMDVISIVFNKIARSAKIQHFKNISN
jgi:putative endonuclease